MAYIVGKDNDSRDTLKIRVMRQAGHYMASMWKQTLYPVPFSEEFTVDGQVVEVSVQAKKQVAKIDEASE